MVTVVHKRRRSEGAAETNSGSGAYVVALGKPRSPNSGSGAVRTSTRNVGRLVRREHFALRSSSPKDRNQATMIGLIGGPIKVPPKPKRRMGIKEPGGTHPYEYGQVARQPNTDYLRKSTEARMRARELEAKERAAQAKEAFREYGRFRFDQDSFRRLSFAKARQQFALAMRAVDADVQCRRERLREVLRSEDDCLTAQLIARAQQTAQARLRSAMDEQLRLKAEREAERLRQVEKLRLQQYRNRCDEIRGSGSKKIDEFTRDAQLYQIHEKMWLKKKQKEEDAFWDEIQARNRKAMALREEQEERAQKAKALELARGYLETMQATGRAAAEERLRAKAEAAAVLGLIKEQIDVADEEGKGKCQKQLEYRAALDKQRLEKHELHRATEQAERRFDLAMAAFGGGNDDWDKSKQLADLERRRKELNLYMDYKRDEKRQQLEQERRDDELRNAIALQANSERESRHRQIEAEYRKRAQEAHSGLVEQIADRQQRAKAAAAEAAAEEEQRQAMRAHNACLDEQLKRAAYEKELRLQRDLVEQHCYEKAVKAREEALEKERLETAQREEEELDAKLKALMEEHYPLTMNALQAAAIAFPPPDVAGPMPRPPKPLVPCSELEGLARAKAAADAARPRGMDPEPEARAAPRSGVGPCDSCGGFRVQQPCATCKDRCADMAYAADREGRALAADKSGPMSLTGPWNAWLEQSKNKVWNGLGNAAEAIQIPPPPWTRNCHAPPAAPALLPDPFACERLTGKKTGRGLEELPQPQCYMRRC